jgi:hypothetical protein
MAGRRTPFASLEERLLLADLAVGSLSNDEAGALALKLVESDKSAAEGWTERIAAEVTKVYEPAVKTFA